MTGSKVHTREGKPVDESWLAQQAVLLLERAQQADDVDHAACVRYLDLLAKVLLPKSGTATEVAAAGSLLEQARSAADLEKKAKLGRA